MDQGVEAKIKSSIGMDGHKKISDLDKDLH